MVTHASSVRDSGRRFDGTGGALFLTTHVFSSDQLIKPDLEELDRPRAQYTIDMLALAKCEQTWQPTHAELITYAAHFAYVSQRQNGPTVRFTHQRFYLGDKLAT